MTKHPLVVMSLMLIAGSAAHADGTFGCDDKLRHSLLERERIVNSLRPDKPSQMRVFASDGSEFTAGQALWMKGQLRLAEKACTRGDAEDAARRLAAVQELLNEHRRSP